MRSTNVGGKQGDWNKYECLTAVDGERWRSRMDNVGARALKCEGDDFYCGIVDRMVRAGKWNRVAA